MTTAVPTTRAMSLPPMTTGQPMTHLRMMTGPVVTRPVAMTVPAAGTGPLAVTVPAGRALWARTGTSVQGWPPTST
jgi:hypothetical protein